MVWDRFFDSDEEGCLMAFSGWRCMSCGEIIDPVILANRVHPPPLRKRRPRYPRVMRPVSSRSLELVQLG
jgi:hypothetical protein